MDREQYMYTCMYKYKYRYFTDTLNVYTVISCMHPVSGPQSLMPTPQSITIGNRITWGKVGIIIMINYLNTNVGLWLRILLKFWDVSHGYSDYTHGSVVR